jgi:hypothetical protein
LCVFSPNFSQELLLLLDNEKEGRTFFLPVEGREASRERRRAVLLGQVWSSDLAEALLEIYSPLVMEGYTLEDLSQLVQEPSDDRPGD